MLINGQLCPKEKAYELQTWYADGVRRPVSPTRSRSQSHDDASDKYWPISREQKGTETPKLAEACEKLGPM